MPATFPKRFASALTAVSVAVLNDDALAHELGLPIAPIGKEPADDYDFLLSRTGDRLELQDRRDPQLKPMCLDFSDIERRPYAAGLSRRQPLARAVGKV